MLSSSIHSDRNLAIDIVLFQLLLEKSSIIPQMIAMSNATCLKLHDRLSIVTGDGSLILLEVPRLVK